MTFLPLTKTIRSQSKLLNCLLLFHSYFQVECSLTCPVGATVASREAQEITCSRCCWSSTASQYVTDTTQRLIYCIWTANVMFDSKTNLYICLYNTESDHKVRVQPHCNSLWTYRHGLCWVEVHLQAQIRCYELKINQIQNTNTFVWMSPFAHKRRKGINSTFSALSFVYLDIIFTYPF